MGAQLPFITKVVNLSLSEEIMPSELKKALLLPLLKKMDLDPEILKHFHPVSTLTCISKLVGSLIAICLCNHIVTNNLDELRQSAYKQFHSTETVFLKIQNDMLSSVDRKDHDICHPHWKDEEAHQELCTVQQDCPGVSSGGEPRTFVEILMMSLCTLTRKL